MIAKFSNLYYGFNARPCLETMDSMPNSGKGNGFSFDVMISVVWITKKSVDSTKQSSHFSKFWILGTRNEVSTVRGIWDFHFIFKQELKIGFHVLVVLKEIIIA
jgi:hypothetical protein